MAWEVILKWTWIIGLPVLCTLAVVITIHAGLDKVRHLNSLSKTVRAQRKKISELGSEIMGLKSKLTESRRENTALRSRMEDLQRQLGAMENKLKAANLLIEQTNEKLQRRGKL